MEPKSGTQQIKLWRVVKNCIDPMVRAQDIVKTIAYNRPFFLSVWASDLVWSYIHQSQIELLQFNSFYLLYLSNEITSQLLNGKFG